MYQKNCFKVKCILKSSLYDLSYNFGSKQKAILRGPSQYNWEKKKQTPPPYIQGEYP